jgi:hypothetical protein
VWDNPYDTGNTKPSSEPASLKNGLVAYYPFNGNANDESGNNLNGTVFGATLTTDRFSGSTAYYFNGSSYIRADNSPLINFGTNSFTLSCWVQSSGINRWQHFITHSDPLPGPNKGGYALRYDNSQPTYLQGNNNSAFGNSAPPVNKLNWNHIISVYDTSMLKVSIYVNGNLAVTNNIPLPLQSVNNKDFLYLGVENPIISLPSGPQFLTGKLDDVRIYNRALTQEEITYLANN